MKIFVILREYLDEELSKLLKDHIKDKKEQEQLLKKELKLLNEN